MYGQLAQPATQQGPFHRVAGDTTAAGRRRQAALAGHEGDAATARALLADPDPRVRATALGALERCGALRPDEIDHARQDPAPAVRARAAEILAAAGPAFDAVALAPLLADPDPTIVEVAAWAAGERLAAAAEGGRPPPEAGLVEVLATIARDHDDALCREAAVAALGSIGDGEGLPAILAAMADRATVRRRAVIALAPFEGDEVDAALAHALKDRDWQVRQAAEDLLADEAP